MDRFERSKRYLNNSREIALVVLAILLALITGTSYILGSSLLTPVLVLAAIVSIVAFFTWLKKPIWALYFTIFVVLLPTSLIPAQLNSYVNRIATLVALGVWVIDIIRKRSRIIVSPSTLLMVGFIIWSATTLVWAEYFSEGLNILQRYVLRLLLFLVLVINEIRTKKDLDGLMNTLALSGGLLVIVSIYTILNQGYTSGTQLQVLNENTNELGIDLLIFMPAVFWWAHSSNRLKSSIKKSFAIIFFLASIGLIGLSGSRGSAISLGITLIAFLIWKPTRSWGILGLVIVSLAAIVAPIVFSTTIARFLGETGDTALGGREYLWSAGSQLIKDHLILGVGIGNSPYQIIPYLANVGIFNVRWLSLVDASLHNPILVIWAETGLPGLLLYLGVLVSAIILFIRQYIYSLNNHDKTLFPYFAMVASVFAGYMVSWIKGGVIESGYSYFLILSLLIIPSYIKIAINNQNHGE